MAVDKVFRSHIKPDSSTVSYGKMGVKTMGSLETSRTPDGHSRETRPHLKQGRRLFSDFQRCPCKCLCSHVLTFMCR